MERFNLYIFDFDGTLVDSIKGLVIFFNNLFGHYGVHCTREQIEDYLHGTIEHAVEDSGCIVDDEQEFTRLANIEQENIDVIKNHKIYDDCFPLFDWIIKNNIQACIMTGNDKNHVQNIFKYFKIPKFYTTIVGHDEQGRGKPYPDGLYKSLDLNNYHGDKQKVCYVGDSLGDIEAAHRAGIKAIFIDRTGEYKNTEEDIKIYSLKELITE